MPARDRDEIARQIVALCHGKALYSLTPVLEALAPEQRERVFRFLAAEYETLRPAVAQLLSRIGRRRS